MKVALTSLAIAALWGGIPGGAIQQSADSPTINLRVVGCQDAASLTIRYFLYGAFGGQGGDVRTEAGRSDYIIPAAHKGLPAESLRALVYCPHHEIMQLTEFSFAEPLSQPMELQLAPLGSVRLAGKVMYPSADKVAGTRIEVIYHAYWTHRFWDIIDGPVDTFKVASTDVSDDGSFEVFVPDFASDPVVASYSEKGVLRLIARESKTGNIPYELELAQMPGRPAELVIAGKYPRLELYRVPRR
jgi:hypothetical protein